MDNNNKNSNDAKGKKVMRKSSRKNSRTSNRASISDGSSGNAKNVTIKEEIGQTNDTNGIAQIEQTAVGSAQEATNKKLLKRVGISSI